MTLVLIDAADAGRYESGAAGGAAPGPPSGPGPVPESAPVPVPDEPSPSPVPSDGDPPVAHRTAPSEPSAKVVAATDGASAQDDTTADVTADLTDDDDHAIIDVTELEDADVATSGIDKLTKAFPGAVLVEGGEGST